MGSIECRVRADNGENHDLTYWTIAADSGAMWLRNVVSAAKKAGQPVTLRA
jgi:hypothetical protein